MTKAEKEYKDGKFNPEPIMKQYADIMDDIGILIEDSLDPLRENLSNIANQLPEFANDKKHHANSLVAKVSAVTSTLYTFIDEIDAFTEILYWTYYNAGKEDYNNHLKRD